MPTTCWGVQRHHRALLPLLLAQPRSEGLCCQHTRPWRSLSTAGSRRLVQLWSLKEAVLDLPRWWLLVLPWLWVVFQACRFQYHRYCVMPQNDSGCGIPFFRLAGTSGGRCPSSSGGGFYGKSSNSSSKKEGHEMTLDRFYPSFEFQRHWRVLQLMWAQECSLCDCTLTANLLTAGLAAWLGTSSLALKVCSQATSLAEFQVSCVITELE